MHELTNPRRPLACLAAVLLAAAVGCGDQTICPSEVAVVITTPTDGTLFLQEDGSPLGTRTDVLVQTNLAADEVVTLEVFPPAQGTGPYLAAVDPYGTAMFSNVLIPPGQVTLRASGTSAECGEGVGEIDVVLHSDESCRLRIRQQPALPNTFYGVPVLARENDTDPVQDDFQADIDITTLPGYLVRLFEVDVEQGTESLLAVGLANSLGRLSTPVTLGQGRKALRATCSTSPDGPSASSAIDEVYVDTVAPTCTLLGPGERTTLVSQMDEDADAPGTQITFTGQVTPAADAASELAQLVVSGNWFAGGFFDAGGNGTVQGTFFTPETYEVSFVGQDHAGNLCAAMRRYLYRDDGCLVQLVDPQTIITSDVNANGADGVQADLQVQVDAACEGGEVFTSCGVGVGAAPVTVPAGGLTTIRTTLCQAAQCTTSLECTIYATTPAGVQSTLGVTLQVDNQPPGAIPDLSAIVANRQAIAMSWTAPAEFDGAPAAGYVVKIAEEPLDESNFDTAGVVVASPAPAEPGTVQSMFVEQLRAGTPYHVAVAAVDPVGNRSPIASLGPLIPDLKGTGSLEPVQPEAANNGLGYQLAAGDFNDDGFGDLAVAAPFKQVGSQLGRGTVYVYLGGVSGLGTVPDVAIEGVADGGQLGNGLTALDWDGDGTDDLAAGAPLAGNGRVHVFLGGDGFAAFTRASQADVTIEAAGATGDWFAGSALGWSLTTARFDDDERDDLILGAPAGGAGNGGLVVLYGGALATSIRLSDLDSSGSGDARALVIEDPDTDPATTSDDLFGQSVFNLGRTEGVNDTSDDIGVAYFERPAAVVVRGRARPAPRGVQRVQIDPVIDLVIRNATPDPTVRFGAAMGSIADMNGDGAREIVVSGWREGNNLGRVFVLDGDQVGTHDAFDIDVAFLEPDVGVAQDAGLGSAVVNNARSLGGADIDRDGREDLLVVGGMGDGQVTMLVWYGGAIPTGRFTPSSAQHTIVAPAGFQASGLAQSDFTAMAAIWAGDINGDGLEDIAWADSITNQRDGLFELLSDGLF